MYLAQSKSTSPLFTTSTATASSIKSWQSTSTISIRVNRCNRNSQHEDRDLSKSLHHPPLRRSSSSYTYFCTSACRNFCRAFCKSSCTPSRPMRSRRSRCQFTQQHLQSHHRPRHRPLRLRRPPPQRRLRPHDPLVQLPPRRVRRLRRHQLVRHPRRRLELDRPGLLVRHGLLAPGVQWQRPQTHV